MGWTPPTEDEFNNSWVTPLEALDVLEERMAEDHDKWGLLEQLRGGQIVAVARTAQVNPTVGAVQPLVRISAGAWRRAGQSAQYHFWKTGHLVVPGVTKSDDHGGVLTGEQERYFNIRFDPRSFSGRPPPAQEDQEEIDAPEIYHMTPQPLPLSRTDDTALQKTTGFVGPRLQDYGKAVRKADERPEPILQPPRRKGGRPAGKYGEPIARITLRLAALPPEQLARYTAESLGLELIAEFRNLGWDPPSEDNATRDAAGILRVVRN